MTAVNLGDSSLLLHGIGLLLSSTRLIKLIICMSTTKQA